MDNQLFAVQAEKNLEVTQFMKSQLKETSKWTKFLAILGFIGLAIMILAALLLLIVGSLIPMSGEIPSYLLGVIYLIFAGVYFMPVKYLYDFSKQMNRAVTMTDQLSFSGAINSLKSHYKFVGIFTIVVFSLYLLIFISAIVIAVASDFIDV